MATFFLSYSRDDAARASVLANDIRSLGHDAWIDQELTGGQRWWDQILSQIQTCDAFISAVSASSMDSRACLAEYEYARDLGKPVLPVMVQHGVADSLMPPHLAQVQRVDYTEGDKSAFATLTRAILSLPPAPPLPNPLPEAPEVPASYLFDLKTEISSPGTMTGEMQTQLVAELRSRLAAGHSRADVASLVQRFRQRDDLLVRTDQELASLEASLGDTSATTGQDDSNVASAPEPVPTPRPAASPAPAQAAAANSAEPAFAAPAPRTGSSPSPLWWAAALFGIIGGAVAYFALKNRDSDMARNVLIAGIVVSVVLALLSTA